MEPPVRSVHMRPMNSPEPRTGHPRPTSPKTAAVPLGAYSMRPFVRQAGVAQAWLGEKTPLASSYNLVRDDRRRRVALVRTRARLARAARRSAPSRMCLIQADLARNAICIQENQEQNQAPIQKT